MYDAVRIKWAFGAILSACFFVVGCLVVPEPSIEIHGREYRSLESMAERYQADISREEEGEWVVLSGSFGQMEFRSESREFRLNDLRIFMGEAVLEEEGSLYVSSLDIQKYIQPLLETSVFAPIPQIKTIVLDAGHGGRDMGAQNKMLGLKEKDLTLKVVGHLKNKLEAKGYSVFLTREKDHYLSLDERTKITQDQDADLFLSIHFNAAENLDASGIETYILTPQFQRSTSSHENSPKNEIELDGNRLDPWNAVAGFYVHRLLMNDLGGTDRGLKRARFSVLRNQHCPSLLIEAAFLSNEAEAQRVKTDAFQKRLAHSIVTGVEVYERMLKRIQNKDTR